MFSSFFFHSRLFDRHFPGAVTPATYSFVVLWLAATVFNMRVGISHAATFHFARRCRASRALEVLVTV